MAELYRFQMVRYAPNRVSEEFYNVAVLLYGADGKLVDARFAPDFARLRCHPLADLDYLRQVKEEFENRKLAGEGFSQYVEQLRLNLSQGLHLSEEKGLLAEDPLAEMERLTRTYLATPRRSEGRSGGAEPGTRRWIQERTRESFRLYHLLERLETEVQVGAYVSPRFSFRVDYACRPNGRTHYVHSLSLEHDMTDAPRLCFVFDRIRGRQTGAAMTAVVADQLPGDTRELLGSSDIRPCPVSQLDELALALRQELGL